MRIPLAQFAQSLELSQDLLYVIFESFDIRC